MYRKRRKGFRPRKRARGGRRRKSTRSVSSPRGGIRM